MIIDLGIDFVLFIDIYLLVVGDSVRIEVILFFVMIKDSEVLFELLNLVIVIVDSEGLVIFLISGSVIIIVRFVFDVEVK